MNQDQEKSDGSANEGGIWGMVEDKELTLKSPNSISKYDNLRKTPKRSLQKSKTS